MTGSTYDWSAPYGGKPAVPDPGASARSAIGSNIGNLGQLYQLGGDVNAFQQEQLLGQYGQAIPGYENLVGKAASNVGSQLAGNIPSDVVNQIVQSAAERGVYTGNIGSPNANAALLRAMGLTSLGMQQSGQAGLISLTGAAPIAAPFDISRMFINPSDVQEAQMAANMYASAPIPARAAGAAAGAASGPGVGWNRTTTGGLPAPGINVGQPGGVSRVSYDSGQFLPDFTQGGWGPAYYDQPAVGPYAENIQQQIDPYSDWQSNYGSIPGLGLYE